MIQSLILLVLLVGSIFLNINYFSEHGLPPIVSQFIEEKTDQLTDTIKDKVSTEIEAQISINSSNVACISDYLSRLDNEEAPIIAERVNTKAELTPYQQSLLNTAKYKCE